MFCQVRVQIPPSLVLLKIKTQIVILLYFCWCFGSQILLGIFILHTEIEENSYDRFTQKFVVRNTGAKTASLPWESWRAEVEAHTEVSTHSF